MKKCPMCAEQVQDDARVCRFCQHPFDKSASPRKPLGCGGALVIVLGLTLLVALCSGDPDELLEEPSGKPAALAILPAAAVAKCRELLAIGEKGGVIRARPDRNRINVEDRLWAQLDSETKDRTMQAVACDVWGTAMPPPGEHVVAYGYRSGKRVQMLTEVGMDRE